MGKILTSRGRFVLSNGFTMAVPPTVSYTVTGTATNCLVNNQSSYSGTITSGGFVSLALTANGTSYKLPESVTVTGASKVYTRVSDQVGTLVISNPTGNVSFSVVADDTVNLKGDQWKFNGTISSMPADWNVKFSSNGVIYNSIIYSVEGSTLYIKYDTQIVYNFNTSTWTDENYKTLIFIDGTDIKSNSLYNWLVAYATKLRTGLGHKLLCVPENASFTGHSSNIGTWTNSGSFNDTNNLYVESVNYSLAKNQYCRLLDRESGEVLQSDVEFPFYPDADTYELFAHSEASAECIDYYTQVTMADGTFKNLGDIEVGDEVLSIDFDKMKLISRRVIYSGRDEEDYDQWITNYYIRNEFSDGSVIKQSMRHRMYNLENQAYVHLDDVWQKGQHCYNIDGSNPTLVRRVLVNEPQHYARITLEGCNNYFANGLSTGDSECPTGIILNKKLDIE